MLHDPTMCPSPDSAVAAVKRQTSNCPATTCDTCVTTPGCTWCTVKDNGVDVSSSCTALALCDNFYAHNSATEHATQYCNGGFTDGTSTADLEDFILVFSGQQSDKNAMASGISSSFDTFYGVKRSSKHLDADNVRILAVTPVQGSSVGRDATELTPEAMEAAKRQGTLNTRCIFTVVAPADYTDGQSQCNTDVENWLESLTLGAAIAPGLVPVGRSGAPPGSSSSSNLSGGDLAAIIIACIIGAALIAAILLWVLLLRRKGGHPAPFRSPAAAFRP